MDAIYHDLYNVTNFSTSVYDFGYDESKAAITLIGDDAYSFDECVALRLNGGNPHMNAESHALVSNGTRFKPYLTLASNGLVPIRIFSERSRVTGIYMQLDKIEQNGVLVDYSGMTNWAIGIIDRTTNQAPLNLQACMAAEMQRASRRRRGKRIVGT